MIWPGLSAKAMSLATTWPRRLAPLTLSFSVSAWAGARGQGAESCAGGEKGADSPPCLSLLLFARPCFCLLCLCLLGIGLSLYVKKIKENDS